MSALLPGRRAAHVYANRTAVSAPQQPLADGWRRLPDGFWVFGPVQLWRRVDWLVLRTGPRPHVFAVTVAHTAASLRGFQNSAWEAQGPDGWWRPVAVDVPDDQNYLGQATNTADTALTYLRERGFFAGGGRIWPVLLILSDVALQHQLPAAPVDAWGSVVLSVSDCLNALQTIDPGDAERIAVTDEDAQRLLAHLQRANGLVRHEPTAASSPVHIPIRMLLPAGAVILLTVAAVSLATWARPLVQELAERSGAAAWIGVRLDAGDEPAPFCQAGQGPAFLQGFGTLKAELGGAMGEPVECEHADPDSGDVLQRTTTGLAYYRPALNLPMFTNGVEHWALTPRGLLYWQGESVLPPPDATLLGG